MITSLMWLNVFASFPGRGVFSAAATSVTLVYTLLLFRLIRLQDRTRKTQSNSINPGERVRAIYAWVVLSLLFSVPVVSAGAILAFRNWRLDLQLSEYSVPSTTLQWVCLSSLFFGGILFRPWVMRIPVKTKWLFVLVVAGCIGMGIALECIWRNDWYLFTLSSVSFLGVCLGSMRIVDSQWKVAEPERMQVH